MDLRSIYLEKEVTAPPPPCRPTTCVCPEVAVAALWGGGLRTTTADGWVLHRIAPHWPTEGVVLCPPSAPELSMDPSGATLLVSYRDTPIRAFGFSDSGRSIVVATTDLHVWTR